LNTSQLKQFAQNARRQLIELVSTKLSIVLDAGSAARRENEKAVKDLEKEIYRTSEDQVIEKVAYIWFNRFCALRFMDVNRYTTIGVVSSAEGFSQPEILMEAKQGHIDAGLRIDKDKVYGLLNETIPSPEPQQEAYRMLLVAVCNDYNSIMPFLFERIADYTELLMPDDLLSDSSILTATRGALSEEACADVEVIGWLYQFYISEKKDEVFAGLKKNKKVTPENIPAATQLFTPNWIVRYLVENSLGRLWMLNNPGSRLIDKMEYYIKQKQEETDFLVIESPEEIKICDPACGSGHMLVYAFEILYAIYEEQGYDAPKIPQLILENNLYGIEIDERAGELAAFALCMKAREKYRRFFKKDVQPSICVLQNVTFEASEVKSYLDAVNPDLFTQDFSTLLYQFKEADNFGSLIRPELTNISDVLRLIDEKKVADDMFLQDIHKRALKVLEQAEYLSPKYHIVITNPPYMGAKKVNGRLGKWARENYAVTKSDLFAMFIERNLDMTRKKGIVAMITMQSWMFLSSYEKLRNRLLSENIIFSMAHIGARGFDSIGGEVVSTTAFLLKNNPQFDYRGDYLRLIDGNSEIEKKNAFLEGIKNKNCGWFFRASSLDFKKIPSNPIAYWVSDQIRNIFANKDLGDIAKPRQGLSTSDNNRFLKFWYEVSYEKIGFKMKTRDEAKESKKKWFPYNKGGTFRKWYGNQDYVINWENDGEELREWADYLNRVGTSMGRLVNKQFYFKPSITWSALSSSAISLRYNDYGFIFDSKGQCVFSDNNNDLFYMMGLLNSCVAIQLLKIMAPTLDFNSGTIAKIPYINSKNKEIIIKNVKQKKEIAENDWNSMETSWGFKTHFLIESYKNSSTIEEVNHSYRSQCKNQISQMEKLEIENNGLFINTYGLENELKADIPFKEITLFCNPHYRYESKKTDQERQSSLLNENMREFIAYSVGCMFGRYSLDKKGLILANQGETIENYLAKIPEPTFEPDDDNVIPIMDVDWFTDDIAERFKRFLKVAFGEEHYTENLEFIEKAIGKDTRKFFLKDFYTYHVKVYKKRPIYWMFSSPKGSFNALIYMHRYRPDTVSIVLNDYLREFRTKLTARKDNLENISISTSASQGEKTKALKEIEKIKKVLDEVDEYERDILYPLATQQMDIDLDDGVKVNYPKFGKALKKVAGLS
jgi:type II restriction/modification system DNA methylase subunit YeeA